MCHKPLNSCEEKKSFWIFPVSRAQWLKDNRWLLRRARNSSKINENMKKVAKIKKTARNDCGNQFIKSPKLLLQIILIQGLLRLGLPSNLFPSDFPTKTQYTPVLSPIRATCPAPLILLDFIIWRVMGEQYRSLNSSLYSSLHPPCYIVPPRSKYSPQHPILKHPQPTFLPHCERPSFMPIQNNEQNCNSVHFNL